MPNPIRLASVQVSEGTKAHIRALLDDGLIGQSSVIERFEQAFANWLGVKDCVAVSSGTMADTIALAVLKHLHPGKTDVVMPALTFAAQLNSVLYNGLTPVFYDHPGNVLSMTSQLMCVFPVHLMGRPYPWRIHGYPVVEDACEALGSISKGQKVGTIGDLGTFSFFPSHTVTTGEGGMIATNNAEYAALARRLRNHGKTNTQDFHFDAIGFNGKMTSLQAALGLGLLETLDQAIDQRRRNFLQLGGIEGPGEYICPHGLPLVAATPAERERALKTLRAHDIECRNLFSCLPTQEPAYAFLGYHEGDFPVAEDLGRRAFYVPTHQGLSDADLKRISAVVETIQTVPYAW